MSFLLRAGWMRRIALRLVRQEPALPPAPGELGGPAGEALLAIHPPEGVRLVGWRPAKTGEGGRGLVARYSDGTTASAMVNSDGSVRVLFFRDGQVLPAIPLAGEPGRRFTW
jgi:hypothetical protein